MKKMKKAALAFAGVGALLLAGCSGSNAASSDIPKITNPAAGEVEDGVLDGVTLNYVGDGGPAQDAQFEAFFTPFGEKSGAKFTQDSPQLIAKLEAQVKAGNYQTDFVSMTPDSVERFCGTVFEELDTSQLDLSLLPEGFPEQSKCGIPSIVYGTVLEYDPKAFPDKKPESWKDFFDTETFPGTRSFYQGGGQVDAPAVQAGALAAGWDPEKEDFNLEWANKGMDMLESIKDDLVFYDTGARAQQMIENGEAKMIGAWTGRVLTAERNGAEVGVVWDGWIKITDNFAILKGSPNSQAVYYALNYANGAEQQAKWAELSGYSPTNKEAKPQLDEVAQPYLLTTEERQAQGVAQADAFWADAEEVKPIQDRWAALVAGG